MFPHDSVNRVEAESGSLADAFGREKWLEDAWLHFRRYAGPAVTDLDRHTIIILKRPNIQIAFAIHSVRCVVDQICPDLVQLAAKRTNQQRPIRIFPMYGHSSLQFVIKNNERVLQAPDDIHILHGSLIHVGIFLDRAHKVGNT